MTVVCWKIFNVEIAQAVLMVVPWSVYNCIALRKSIELISHDIVMIQGPSKGGRGCLMSPPVWNLRAVI